MYHSLTGLANTVVLDTNVLLNGCFVSDSAANAAIQGLLRLGYFPIIDKAIVTEAITILRRIAIKRALLFDPANELNEYLSYSRIVVLPKASARSSAKVNKADRHIYSAAIEYKAWVLTYDLNLAAQLHTLGPSVRLPWDVILEEATKAGANPPLDYVLQYIGLARTNGYIFARTYSDKGSTPEVGCFTICDVENVAKLYFDSGLQEWIFQGKQGFTARVKCNTGKEQNWTVCGSYEIDPVTGKGNATLRAIDSIGTSFYSSTVITSPLTASWPGTTTFGHNIDHRDHWNGCISKVVVGPTSINGKTWTALRRLPESAPDPTAGDLLEQALCRVRCVRGALEPPSQQDLNRSWIS